MDSGASLFSSLRSFWGVLIAILCTRLDLLTVELEEEANRAVQLIVVSLAAFLCIGMTIFFFLFFLIVVFWAHAAIVLGMVFTVCVLASVILILVARQMILNRPKFLSQTLTELRRDVEGLRPEVKTAESPK